MDTVKPDRVLVPSLKDLNEPVEMCYDVKRAEGEPKHEKVTGIHMNNQFGPKQVDTEKEEELCVPSEKVLPE